MRTRVKVCCIASHEEAALAASAGVDALGLVGDMPSGPGMITDETAHSIAATVPPPITPWLLTSEETAEGILEHANRCAVSVVQIVKHVDPSVHEVLHHRAPTLRRVQVVHVEDESALDLGAQYGGRPDAFLLDSGRPSAAELGGTGRQHDWAISAQFVVAAQKPVFLAGGLSPDNAADALQTVRPFGLDICSGLRRRTGPDDEESGSLDRALLFEFMAAVRTADERADPIPPHKR